MPQTLKVFLLYSSDNESVDSFWPYNLILIRSTFILTPAILINKKLFITAGIQYVSHFDNEEGSLITRN